jgi:hypothetical protein
MAQVMIGASLDESEDGKILKGWWKRRPPIVPRFPVSSGAFCKIPRGSIRTRAGKLGNVENWKNGKVEKLRTNSGFRVLL